MKINLTICGVNELPAQKGELWTHVVSIWDKTEQEDKSCQELIMTVAPMADHLFSYFYDTSVPDHPHGPRIGDVERILYFTSTLSTKSKVLVHCRAGVSRSTAVAYAILCQHSKPGMEMENLLQVQSLRDMVCPNSLIIKLADKVLRRNGGMLLPLRREPDITLSED
jgi:predicted protein tyrosine phosphatase